MAVDEFSDYPDTGASGSQEYTSPEDASIDFTSQNPRTDYEPPQPDVDYGVGATGNVSTSGRTNSGGGLVAPFIHPFKLEKFTNPVDNSTKVRVYEGDVYAKIDTFELGIITITTGASHTHSAGSYAMPDHSHNQAGTAAAKTGDDITEGDTGSGTGHTHATTGMSVPMADHYHKSGEESGTGTTAEGQQLKLRHHTHSLPNTTGGPTSGTGAASGGSYSGADANHTHTLGGSTGDVDDFGVDDSGNLAPEDITGNTGGLGHTFPAQQISGTIANESSHTHKYNKDDHSHTLTGQTGGLYSSAGIINTSGTNSNSAVDHKFVAVTGQAQAPLDVSTNFAGTFNKTLQFDDETDTIFKYHETAHSTGDFYVKWVITISEAAVVQTIVGSIERVAVGAGAPADSSFGELDQNPSTKALERTDLTGTFHQKIGSVSTTTVDQVQFSNINWSMTVLPEVS